MWVGDEERLVPQGRWPARPQSKDRRPSPSWAVLARTLVRSSIETPCAARSACAKSQGTPSPLQRTACSQTWPPRPGLIIVQQQQAHELQAAARRIVTAEDVARRRIERDLHDGAQQRLVTLGLGLGVLAEQAKAKTKGDDATADRVKEAMTQLLEATAELRELARGLHPMVLAQSGLEPALGTLADRPAIPVRLHVAVPERLPSAVEATAYYIVSEALTNAARHSGASVVCVDVTSVDGWLRVA